MRVRFLSGNSVGLEQDLPELEAQAAIDTGFAERAPAAGAFVDQAPAALPPEHMPAPTATDDDVPPTVETRLGRGRRRPAP